MFEKGYSFKYLHSASGHNPVIKEHYYYFNTDIEKYLMLLEEFPDNFFGIKFYPYFQKKNPNKYNIITNKNNVLVSQKILKTCVDLMHHYISKNKLSSFGFVGSPTIINGVKEPSNCTQRFNIYSRIMPLYFNTNNFIHLDFTEQSAYLVFNKNNSINVLENILNNINLNYEILLGF